MNCGTVTLPSGVNGPQMIEGHWNARIICKDEVSAAVPVCISRAARPPKKRPGNTPHYGGLQHYQLVTMVIWSLGMLAVVHLQFTHYARSGCLKGFCFPDCRSVLSSSSEGLCPWSTKKEKIVHVVAAAAAVVLINTGCRPRRFLWKVSVWLSCVHVLINQPHLPMKVSLKFC